MDETKLIAKLDKKLIPFATKLGNQIHLKAISAGMMFGLPFIVVGSLFLIIANPPINMDLYDPAKANLLMKGLAAWKEFAVANYTALTTPYDMTFGLFGVICAFGIAYCLAKDYNLIPSTNGFISLVIFMMISTQVKDGSIQMEYLGTNGLFTAIIVSLIVVEIARFVQKKTGPLKCLILFPLQSRIS